MPQSQNENDAALNAFSFPAMQAPVLSLFADVNRTVLQAIVAAQKDWAEFVHGRVSEDLAVMRQLMQCRSPADMHQVYSQYLSKAAQQYQELSAKIAQHGQAMAERLTENGPAVVGSRCFVAQ